MNEDSPLVVVEVLRFSPLHARRANQIGGFRFGGVPVPSPTFDLEKFFPLVLLVVLPQLVKMHLVFTDMNHELGRKSDGTNDAGVLT